MAAVEIPAEQGDTSRITSLLAAADRYYVAGCDVVARIDWCREAARSVTVAADRARYLHTETVLAARARSLFKRHDVALDGVQRLRAAS